MFTWILLAFVLVIAFAVWGAVRDTGWVLQLPTRPAPRAARPRAAPPAPRHPTFVASPDAPPDDPTDGAHPA
jgi:hypothetical protein